MFKYQLIDLAPVARSLVMDYIEDGLCVLDDTGRILDNNTSFQRIARPKTDIIKGSFIGEVLPAWGIMDTPAWIESFGTVIELPGEDASSHEGASFECASLYYEMRVQRLLRGKNQSLGLLVTLHDVTEHKRLLAAIEQLAVTDSLTGLFNRRYFNLRALEEVERSRRLDHSLSILMLDLDHFKDVNDTYGHDAGDLVLVAVAGLLRGLLRKIDISARYGGEEFIVLLPESGGQAAVVVAERIRQAVETQRVETGPWMISFSISIGVASLEPGMDLSLDDLIRHADQAMYEAKSLGRNLVYEYEAGGGLQEMGEG